MFHLPICPSRPKTILDKIPPMLTQVAFGITGVKTNPDFLKMLRYTREKGIIPNFTLSGIDLEPAMADEIVKYIGAVAVSIYTNKNVGYDTVKMFTDRGIKQVNLHLMVSKESLKHVYEVLNDRLEDSRLALLNAVVFLGVKPKGRGTSYHPLSIEEFKTLTEWCVERKLSFGFDSCSAHKFSQVIPQLKVSDATKYIMSSCTEPCESSCFSSYINVKGEYWNCSFCENNPEVKPVSVLEAKDFIEDVWNHPNVVEFRNRVLATREVACPIYDV